MKGEQQWAVLLFLILGYPCACPSHRCSLDSSAPPSRSFWLAIGRFQGTDCTVPFDSKIYRFENPEWMVHVLGSEVSDGQVLSHRQVEVLSASC